MPNVGEKYQLPPDSSRRHSSRTGKTTVLTAIENAHIAAGGARINAEEFPRNTWSGIATTEMNQTKQTLQEVAEGAEKEPDQTKLSLRPLRPPVNLLRFERLVNRSI